MGNCQNCGRSITLRNMEKDCPNCGKSPYQCWDCHVDVRGGKECPACHFFICDNCSQCGFDCIKPLLLKEIMGMKPEQIVDYVLRWKNGKIRANCSRNVGISYAKGKIKNTATKLQGYYISKEDLAEYKARINEITKSPIGTKWTIKVFKKDGYHGQEERETLNLGVCMGWVKKYIKENDKGNKYELFVRCKSEQCQFANWDKLVVSECPSCNETYDGRVEYCPRGCRYKRGKSKGEIRKLKHKLSGCDFCDLPRKDFITEKEDVKDGCCGAMRPES